ncbi:GerMN domain-containing protein [Actinomadura sp. ATCC 31491]|uniref:GerMN domain-containing protein n=1 Tax=Actinomadura luzonensis TaxID=2805427 RepID=A0ABT0G1N1_9ACTN|nr:GerMN domain-containing protein [Actinomadura luzonensis]MCK2218313.1 GerMN domain-containing protein [Actinomadura luzonensis]
MLPIRPLIAGAALAAAVTVPVALPAQAAQLARVPTLIGVRAAHQPGFDRLVFEFRGGLPRWTQTSYVDRVVDQATGRTVGLVGDALLRVRFEAADAGAGTARTTYPLPGLIQVAGATPYNSTLTYGVGLARRTPYRVHKLTRPSRVVVDITTPYRTVPVRDHFLNTANYNAGRLPYTTAVQRPAVPPATAYGALQRLFAGPTPAEKAQGLRFVSSKATGFSRLTVQKGIARVYLTGPVTGAGSTFTIADEIMPTLKQFPSVTWVKIYDAGGHTQYPYGPSDSVPNSLEP